MLAGKEVFAAVSHAELPCFSLFPHLKPKLKYLSADGEVSGHVAGDDEVDDEVDDEGNAEVDVAGDNQVDDSDDGASSAEQPTQQVPAQQPEQPSQPASAPSLQRMHHSMPLPHPPEQPLPQSLDPSVPLGIDAESSAHLTSSCIHLPAMESSCSDDRQPPCSLGVLMPEDPCLLPKSGFSTQQPPDK